MWNVIVIPADNNMPVREVSIKQTGDALRELLGGNYFEHVRIGNFLTRPPVAFEDVAMWVDEDGIAHGLSQNDRASILYGVTVHGQGIYGDAVLTGEEFDPEEGRDIASLQEPYADRRFWAAHFMRMVALLS